MLGGEGRSKTTQRARDPAHKNAALRGTVKTRGEERCHTNVGPNNFLEKHFHKKNYMEDFFSMWFSVSL